MCIHRQKLRRPENESKIILFFFSVCAIVEAAFEPFVVEETGLKGVHVLVLYTVLLQARQHSKGAEFWILDGVPDESVVKSPWVDLSSYLFWCEVILGVRGTVSSPTHDQGCRTLWKSSASCDFVPHLCFQARKRTLSQNKQPAKQLCSATTSYFLDREPATLSVLGFHVA